MHVGNALQDLLDAVLLQRPHAFGKRGGNDFHYPRVFLDVFLDCIGAHQQLVQAYPPLVAGAAADVASNRRIQLELSLFVGKLPGPIAVDSLVRGLRVALP